MQLEILKDILAITKLSAQSEIPNWCLGSPFLSITRTFDELSIVSTETLVPGGLQTERNWSALKIVGTLDFSLTGILASIAKPLADSGFSIFAISTYDTDYILVKQQNLEAAKASLVSAGHTFVNS